MMKETTKPVLITILDRSMACACRPGEQRGFMALKGVLHGIRKEYGDRIDLNYYAYDQTPEVFQSHESVQNLVNHKGLGELPVTLVNGAIRKSGALPTLQELRTFITMASE